MVPIWHVRTRSNSIRGSWADGSWTYDVPRQWNDSSGPRRDSRRLGAAGPGHPGRLDDSTPARPPAGIEPLPGAGNWYGTTLRIYDPELDAWRILWSDPATNFFAQQIGRAQGSDIVQTGPDPRGGSMRWVFSEIQPDSFHWTAERAPDERNWRREVDIRARRG